MTSNHISSPGLRIRSPSAKAKSNVAISRGDDDSSVDDDRINNKMCISDETTIKCVFNKKRLFGGSALAFVAVVVIMAVAIATRSDGGSSSSANHMSKVASVGGGNSNAAVGTAEVGSAAPPKVAPVAPKKVTPVAPVKQSNFAFVAPQAAGIGGGSAVERCPSVSGSGKSGKSGSFCYSSGKSGKSGGHGLINIEGSSWYGSGKSGKSGSFPLPTCDVKSSGKSGKSGYNSFLDAYRVGSDSWYSSGKSGKSGAGYCTLSPENYQNKKSTCVDSDAQDINAGCWLGLDGIDKVEPIKLDQPICASISKYGNTGELDIDVYEFDVLCPGEHTIIIRATGVTPEGPGSIGIGTGGLFAPTLDLGVPPRINPRIYGGADGAECKATGETPGNVPANGPFTSFVGGGDTLLPGITGPGAQPIARFEDRQDGVYALTWILPCGTYYIQMAATLLVSGFIPFCNTPDHLPPSPRHVHYSRYCLLQLSSCA